ncbi:hypothetical protein AB4Z52_29475 [Rhizobium sp. 2YAF20]|uniref:hypothetical protein n=1 Tax=Rhizobium sp. 2YAF20 TaxID=3233027 RepID=UPI003F984C05
MALITKPIANAREKLANMGKEERRKAFAAGVPVVYSMTPDGMITTEYPNGEKVYSAPQIRKLPRK